MGLAGAGSPPITNSFHRTSRPNEPDYAKNDPKSQPGEKQRLGRAACWVVDLVLVLFVTLLGWLTLRSSRFDFESTPFWQNGYVQLSLLGMLLVLLLLAVRWLESRVMRRVQLCVLLSLLIHLGLLLYLGAITW